MSTTAYRPDLDGLRAIAVLSVVVYHLLPGALPGGYLGVDIFFVLSGYLITTIIWREMLAGQFSLAAFYNRRVRRIMPALLFMLLFATIASTLVLLPLDLMGMARSLLAALGFVANIYFWRDTDYFSRVADEKPLLHIWSLGVEEQFYLLFPLLLMLLARWRSRAATVIAALVLLSLTGHFLVLYAGGALPAFYLLPTRAWELGAGALLAALPGVIVSRSWATPLGVGGAALVISSLAGGRSLFPASVPDALAVVPGTALLIMAGMHAGNPVTRALSLRLPVMIGLISYSLYLWHWPVIVLLKYFMVRDLTAIEVATACLVMTACAILSWRFVERPFRLPETPIRSVYKIVGAATLVLAAIGIALIAAEGLPGRLDPAATRINAAVGSNYRCPVTDYLYFKGSRACNLNLASRNPSDADVVLFGNSHAQMYAPLVRDLAAARSLQALLVPMNACTPTLGPNVNAGCAALATRNLEAIASLPRARVVIIASTWPRDAAAFTAGLNDAIAHLGAAGKRVVLLGPIATPGWDLPSRLSRSLAFGRELDRPLFEPEAAFLERHGQALASFEGRAGIEFVRPDRIQCAAGRCEYVMDGRSLFADSNHLAATELSRFRAGLDAGLARALAR